MKYRVKLDFYIDEDEDFDQCTAEVLQHIFEEELGGCCTSVSNVELIKVFKDEDDE